MSTVISSHRITALLAAVVLSGVTLPVAYAARTFCCADEKGQQRCGDVLPTACRNRAYTEYNEAGMRVRNVDRPLTEAEQATKDVEEKRKRDLAEAAKRQRRADQALLSTYADERDLATARDRVVSELERSIGSAEQKLADLNKARTKLKADTEFYNNKPLPADLKQKIARNQSALNEQQAAIEEKKKEIEETNAKFDAYRKRLQELKSNKDKDESP